MTMMQNPYADLQTEAQNVLEQLQQLIDTPDTTSRDTKSIAEDWLRRIKKSQTFLADKNHPIVFIGSVGVGKSSLIGVAANLIIGAAPKDRASLKNNSVLAIGSGRTTVCEVQIRPHNPESDQGLIGLVLEPVSAKEMEEEIRRYAEDVWHRRQGRALRNGEDDNDPTAQEVQRAIRGMSDYLEHPEPYTEDGVKKQRIVWPLDAAIANYTSAKDFAEHLLARVELPKRTVTQWWWDADTEENLKALKSRFADVNSGTEPTAMLPRRMTLVVPEPLPDSQAGLALTLIDTRGLDGAIEAREDLQTLLCNPRALFVLCSPFKDAPSDTVRTVLRSLASDAQLREAIPRTLLVLLDFGDADQVNGADGDRDYGQELKIEECYIALTNGSVGNRIEKTQLIAFDALKDERLPLLAAIDKGVGQLRDSVKGQLSEQCQDAQTFIVGNADLLRPQLRQQIDEQLKSVMAQHPLVGAPLQDPLAGLYKAIDNTRWASVINATCRRNGAYANLNLYPAISAEASKAATAWLDGLINALPD
jgi:hypothetical protein